MQGSCSASSGARTFKPCPATQQAQHPTKPTPRQGNSHHFEWPLVAHQRAAQCSPSESLHQGWPPSPAAALPPPQSRCWRQCRAGYSHWWLARPLQAQDRMQEGGAGGGRVRVGQQSWKQGRGRAGKRNVWPPRNGMQSGLALQVSPTNPEEGGLPAASSSGQPSKKLAAQPAQP